MISFPLLYTKPINGYCYCCFLSPFYIIQISSYQKSSNFSLPLEKILMKNHLWYRKNCYFKKHGSQVLIQQTWESIEMEDLKCLIKLSYNLLSVSISYQQETLLCCFTFHMLKKIRILSLFPFHWCLFVGIRKSFSIGIMLSIEQESKRSQLSF